MGDEGTPGPQDQPLCLRRLTADDAAAVLAIDTDPRTNAHRPGGAPSRAASEQVFQEFLRCWQERGVGYWAVEFGGQIVGVAGIRPLQFRERDCWNLYYRSPPRHGAKGLPPRRPAKRWRPRASISATGLSSPRPVRPTPRRWGWRRRPAWVDGASWTPTISWSWRQAGSRGQCHSLLSETLHADLRLPDGLCLAGPH